MSSLTKSQDLKFTSMRDHDLKEGIWVGWRKTDRELGLSKPVSKFVAPVSTILPNVIPMLTFARAQ